MCEQWGELPAPTPQPLEARLPGGGLCTASCASAGTGSSLPAPRAKAASPAAVLPHLSCPDHHRSPRPLWASALRLACAGSTHLKEDAADTAQQLRLLLRVTLDDGVIGAYSQHVVLRRQPRGGFRGRRSLAAFRVRVSVCRPAVGSGQGHGVGGRTPVRAARPARTVALPLIRLSGRVPSLGPRGLPAPGSFRQQPELLRRCL